MNLLIGKIVLGANYLGETYDCRVVDKVRFASGDDLYLMVRENGDTFYGKYIKKVYNKEQATALWNEKFHKLFSDDGLNILQ